MSKYMKILSTVNDILRGMMPEPTQHNRREDYELERLCNIVQQLEELSDHQKLYYKSNKIGNEMGSLHILVNDENAEGVPAQVKIFPLESDKSNNVPSNPKNEVNFIREITDWKGRLNTVLPAGNYKIEISKGSEYEINVVQLHIKPNQTSQLTKILIPMLNLQSEGWYSGDLHHHSIYSSPVYGGTDSVIETPAQVCQSMVAMGASYGALSDHHNTLNHKEWAALKCDSFLPILSKEISTSNGHVMALGVEEDIIYRIPENENRTDAYLRKEFIRITDEIKGLGGLPQINHPRDRSRSISWNKEYEDMIQIFETMEIWNGSNPMMKGTTNYEAFLLWQKLLEEGRYIPATAGSDTHNIRANDYHEYMNKFLWLTELITSGKLLLPLELKEEVGSFILWSAKIMPLLKKWVENLTSACVRTYVHVKGEVTREKVLDSLKHGHSFLTNGPVLIPEIEGRLPGETLTRTADYVNISLKLLANRPLTKLTICIDGDRTINYTLETMDTIQGKYDYSRIIRDFHIKDVKWIFFIAEDDCTNMAITNPIFFK